MKLLSHVRLFATPWTVAYQAPLSMGFSRQEDWGGLPLSSLNGAWVKAKESCLSIQHLCAMLRAKDSFGGQDNRIVVKGEACTFHFGQGHFWLEWTDTSGNPGAMVTEALSHVTSVLGGDWALRELGGTGFVISLPSSFWRAGEAASCTTGSSWSFWT